MKRLTRTIFFLCFALMALAFSLSPLIKRNIPVGDPSQLLYLATWRTPLNKRAESKMLYELNAAFAEGKDYHLFVALMPRLMPDTNHVIFYNAALNGDCLNTLRVMHTGIDRPDPKLHDQHIEYCLKFNATRLLRYLLENHQVEDIEQRKAKHFCQALEMGRVECARILLPPADTLTAVQNTQAYRQVIKCRDISLLKMMIESGFNIHPTDNPYLDTPLILAIKAQDTSLGRDLVNDYDELPLHLYGVDIKSRLRMLTLLLEAGADPNQITRDGKRPLHHAMTCTFTSDACQVIDLLHEHGASMNPIDETKIPITWQAINLRDNAMAMHLIHLGSDPNINNAQGLSLLQWSLMKGDELLARQLLIYGADPYKTDQYGHNAIHYTIAFDRIKVLKHMLKNNVTLRQPKGQLPYLFSDRENLSDYLHGKIAQRCISHLLDQKLLNLDLIHEGENRLFRAIRLNQIQIASTLIEHGIDLNWEKAHGVDALEYAQVLMRDEIISLIKKKQGQNTYEYLNRRPFKSRTLTPTHHLLTK